MNVDTLAGGFSHSVGDSSVSSPKFLPGASLFSPRMIREGERRGARYGLVCCHPARVGIPMQEETKTRRGENGRGWVDGWVGE